MEENVIVIDEKVVNDVIEKVIEDDKPSENKNSIKLSTLLTDSITTLLNNVKINDYSKAAELADIIKNRSVLIGDIDEETGSIVDNFIRFWNSYDRENNIPISQRTPIKVCVDSNGGDFLSTLTVIDAIENSETPVWTVNIGRAYSGGLFIMCAGHKRLAYKRSSFLFHEGSSGVSGDANKFQNYADFYKTLRNEMKKIMLEKTNITEEEYISHAKDDWWFLSDEALEKGVIDEIVNGVWYN